MTDQNPTVDPEVRNRHQRADKYGTKFIDKTEKLQEKAADHKLGAVASKQPAGGFDDTPVPHAPPGYTLKITFHRATNLPCADISSLSADPFVVSVIKTNLQKRHKEDPDLVFRTPTVHKNTSPEWNVSWIIANVPKSGFNMKCRLYDEDPSDHDDRLGNVHVNIDHMEDDWPGIREQEYKIKKRMGSKRAYLVRGIAAVLRKDVEMSGSLVISIESLGKTGGDEGGRAYTTGPLAWSRHFSPLIGRLVGTKDDAEEGTPDANGKVQKYNFQAVQMQLQGPVPAPLYHRYVEFKPFVAGMFTDKSLRGRILNRTLHHQHARIYNFDPQTLYGSFPEPCTEMTQKFLELVRYDQGGRIYTYVVLLDGQMRFTETGKEFGIDLLSKHTMHSDVSIYIAFSGEFFVRKKKHPHMQAATDSLRPPSPEPTDEAPATPNKDPSAYELIIDNDSGTYRPNAQYLPTFKEFLEKNFPGLAIMTLDCQDDAEKMGKLKDEQRERKKQAGRQITYLQNHSDSSISSSDESELEERAEGQESDQKSEGHSVLHTKDPKAALMGWAEHDASEQSHKAPEAPQATQTVAEA